MSHRTPAVAGAARPTASWQAVALVMLAVGWGANQFAPMLVVYRAQLDLSAGTQDVLFGLYALGLVPGLLLGGRVSDRVGRRPLVLAFAALSPFASLLLIGGREQVAALALARLLAGACSGVVFGVASAWVQELSAGAPAGAAARRAAIAMSTGFGCGALTTGLLAQWAPDPLWVPYVPHVALGVAALLLALRVPETVASADRPAPSARATVAVPLSRVLRSPRFALVVAPMAPWVFGLAVVSGVVLPQFVHHGEGVAVAFAGVANALTLLVGVAVQPLARRIEDRRALAAGVVGLAVGGLGLGVALLAVAAGSQALIVAAALPLGAAYGMVLVSGLRETERLAPPDARATTIAVYLSLTYVGFGVPYLLAAVRDAVGPQDALALLALALAASWALVASAARRTR